MESQDGILLAEDDRLDQKSVERAFQELQITNRLVIAKNGKEALNHLESSGESYPRLILLDLNMPVMNGVEFLQAIKKDDALKVIPVVVLTTSKEDKDIIESYKLGAAGYMIKPVDYKSFVEVIRTIHSYWKRSRTFPSHWPLGAEAPAQ